MNDPNSSRDFQRLLNAVNSASGWGITSAHAAITFRGSTDGINAAVEICGEKTTVSAWGKDQIDALVRLLQAIESHHVSIAQWHLARMRQARLILDELDVYYVKIEPSGVTK